MPSSGGSVRGTGGGITGSGSKTTCVCLGGGFMAGFGGKAGLVDLSVDVSGVPIGVLLACGGESVKTCGDWTD